MKNKMAIWNIELDDGWCFQKPASDGLYRIVNDMRVEDTAYYCMQTWWKDAHMLDEMYSDEQGVPICWKPM